MCANRPRRWRRLSLTRLSLDDVQYLLPVGGVSEQVLVGLDLAQQGVVLLRVCVRGKMHEREGKRRERKGKERKGKGREGKGRGGREERHTREVQTGLDHVVGIGVGDERAELAAADDFADDAVACRVVALLDNLLHHVRAELLHRQLRDVSPQRPHEACGDAREGQVEDVLHDVVAERVFDERQRVADHLVHELHLLLVGRRVDAALQDAAAVAVRRDGDGVALPRDRVVDELRAARRELVQTALDDVVAVEVLNQLHDVVGKRRAHDRDLLLVLEQVDELLRRTRPVHVDGDAHEVSARLLHDLEPLCGRAVLEQLLAQVVAERVGHELHDVVEHLVEDHAGDARAVLVQQLLERAAPLLVFAHVVDVSAQRLGVVARRLLGDGLAVALLALSAGAGACAGGGGGGSGGRLLLCLNVSCLLGTSGIPVAAAPVSSGGDRCPLRCPRHRDAAEVVRVAAVLPSAAVPLHVISANLPLDLPRRRRLERRRRHSGGDGR